jgi:hypothetical protein
MEEVTNALGKALGRVPIHDRLTFERPLFLFLDDVVRILKEPNEPGDLKWRWEHGNDEFCSPND